jgi:hypothetical protein
MLGLDFKWLLSKSNLIWSCIINFLENYSVSDDICDFLIFFVDF